MENSKLKRIVTFTSPCGIKYNATRWESNGFAISQEIEGEYFLLGIIEDALAFGLASEEAALMFWLWERSEGYRKELESRRPINFDDVKRNT